MKKQKRRAGIDRREALRRLATGSALAGSAPVLVLAGAGKADGYAGDMPMPQGPPLGSAEPPDPELSAKNWKPKFLDEHENQTVIALADLIIPETDTPGAKAAQVNRFIDLWLSVGNPDIQKQYLQALGWLDGHCLAGYSKPFTGLDSAQQHEVLALLTHENEDPRIAYGVNLFRLIKGSIVQAYYSSEIGSLQELEYDPNPFQAEFPGCKNPNEH